MLGADAVLNFWLDEVGPEGWYRGSDALDQRITDRFGEIWVAAQRDDHLGWTSTPREKLALVILLDQFPRNMFRDQAKAFASDKLARCVAVKALDLGWDMRVEEPARQFFYLPLMHSECLGDQERCVRLMMTRLPETGASNLLHARAHREVIRRFGRFPHRNAALGRASTSEEAGFLANGGYGGVVEGLKLAA